MAKQGNTMDPELIKSEADMTRGKSLEVHLKVLERDVGDNQHCPDNP